MENIYDLIILGAGPAGISSAIYAKRYGLKTLWLEKSIVSGGQINNTYEIDNYPGFPHINGAELGETMLSHAESLGITPIRARIQSVRDYGDYKLVVTKKEEYKTKCLIIAAGAGHRHLNIAGEDELSGLGVSYCATCDGAFYKDQTCAVIGGGNTAVEDALLLSSICQKVYLIHRRDSLRADAILTEKLMQKENIEILWNSIPEEIIGEDEVEGLHILNRQSGKSRLLSLNGVFIAIGIVPESGLFEGLVELDKSGFIKSGENCLTSAPGIFAAGDIRTKDLRQVVTAVSDGANAVFSANKFLQNLNSASEI